MATQTLAARADPDYTLAFMDQASYLWVRASGHVHGIQATWVYRRDVDLDGLRRVRGNLARHELLARRVEPSPLPIGRHRWVACHDVPDIEIAEPAHSRAAVTDWFEERGRLPVDPEHGPTWHLGVLPIADYGAAVCLVASHTVIDGVGLCLAVADALNGVTRQRDYPAPRSRPRRQALSEDARQVLRGLPDVARALGGTISLAVRNPPTQPKAAGQSPKIKRRKAADHPVAVPTATVYIDLADWDACAERLGGTSNALLAGFAAKLAQRYGRLRAADNLVTLSYPVNDRTEDDIRANALKGIDFTVDPGPVTTDLRTIRNDFKRTIAAGLGKFSEQERVFPLTPFVPTAVVKKLPLANLNAADLPVGCSNFGEIDAAAAHIDGSPADYFTVRMVEQNLTSQSPELATGELYMTSGRVCGKLFISFRAYQPGAVNTRDALLQNVTQTLADFGLTAFTE
jgi:diacylglycerol O-acyltransferase / wax synthase